MLRFFKIPYIPLALIATLLWGVGSGYWYVCNTQDLCNPEGTKELIAINKAFEDYEANQDMLQLSSENSFGSFANDKTFPEPATVFFHPDSNVPLESNWQEELDKIYDYLDKHPTSTIVVSGYAANVASPVDGIELSTSRARAIAGELVEANYDESRITTRTKGYEDQIGDNSSQEARKANRRAVITVEDTAVNINQSSGGF